MGPCLHHGIGPGSPAGSRLGWKGLGGWVLFIGDLGYSATCCAAVTGSDSGQSGCLNSGATLKLSGPRLSVGPVMRGISARATVPADACASPFRARAVYVTAQT